MEATQDPRLSPRVLARIARDPRKTADVSQLQYVSDSDPGWSRRSIATGFEYLDGHKKIKNAEALARIRKLAIPPAWTQVWICPLENGHLQATGIDALGRKQYRYHPDWSLIRNHTKFYRMLAFGQALPEIRRQLRKDLSLAGMPQQKVLAVVVSLLEHTHIRVGSSQYEKLYGSFGLSTFKNKHVQLAGQEIRFVFRGKKGIQHDIRISDRRLARIMAQCKEIPGKDLFQYYDAEGKRHPVDSGMVNQYIKSLSQGDFSAKDFRTWAGSLEALLFFSKQEKEPDISQAQRHRQSLAMLDHVAASLGNTRSVCKKYYVHPLIIDYYETGQLDKYLAQIETASCGEDWSAEECVLLKLLSKK